MSAPRTGQTRESTHATLEVPGGHLAYETSGQGPAVLFIHSVIADSRMWDRELTVFAQDHQSIKFDLRGFGGSTPAAGPFSYDDDILALLTHLRIQRVFLVGSSMGGAMAIDFALAHPDRVTGLFLAAPGLSGGFEPPFSSQEQSAFDFDERKSQEIAEAWSKGDASRAFDGLRELWCAALEGTNLTLFRQMVERNVAEVFDNRSMRHATSPAPAASRLPTIRTPTTVLLGDRDNPSSDCFAQRIAAAVPGARLVTVPGADHLINLSRPRDFDSLLSAALQPGK
jgi:3-oxoadipate enol-lactonase